MLTMTKPVLIAVLMPVLSLIVSALAVLAPLWLGSPAEAAEAGNVLTYHQSATRDGNFTVPDLTFARAKALRLDSGFHAQIRGHVYAQPLYWHDQNGRGELIVVTENDSVYALDAQTGKTIWDKTLGHPVPLASLPCGDINPLGITGTPVIDPGTGTLYLDAMLRDPKSGAPTHEVFALSLTDGQELSGWPVNVEAKLSDSGFAARYQNQRGALTILDGSLYVPYGGHYGDCGRYHGWVVGIKLRDPSRVASWHTDAFGGGIWAPAGISSDGHALFVATGNTMDARQWGDGEAVIRLNPGPSFAESHKNFFAPNNWRALDARDADLGGFAPVLFDEAGKPLALALGKDGKAYLLDRNDLGGFGGSLASKDVSSERIITAAAVYPSTDGTLVAFHAPGTGCKESGKAALTVLRIKAAPTPSIDTAWCGTLSGAGAPIVTTLDGKKEPIVWMLGAEGDNCLYGFQGETGDRLFVSEPLRGLRHLQTLIATKSHLYVAADDTVYAFSF
jgi:outer membrane protein assembly factor BamB